MPDSVAWQWSFFARAISLDPEQIPPTFDANQWRDDCARAAIRELGKLVRDPHHELEPDWLRHDEDLKLLLSTSPGEAWAGFVGLQETSGLSA